VNRQKYLSLPEECDELSAVCIIKNNLKILGRYFKIFRKFAESIEAQKENTPKEHCPNTPKDIKLSLSQRIFYHNEKINDTGGKFAAGIVDTGGT
jgi:hypothetical protein